MDQYEGGHALETTNCNLYIGFPKPNRGGAWMCDTRVPDSIKHWAAIGGPGVKGEVLVRIPENGKIFRITLGTPELVHTELKITKS